MQKLYCYVDESGQDTVAQSGRKIIFVVAIAVFSANRDELEKVCINYENVSGKRKKWSRTRRTNRIHYIRLVLNDERFRKSLCFSASGPTMHPDYDARTVLGIAKAITWKNSLKAYTAEVYVDGITQNKQSEYATELRKAGIHGVRRVHRGQDESYPLLRLADALAGFIREAIEGEDLETVRLLEQAQRRGMITAL
jgi:hypothetical protein